MLRVWKSDASAAYEPLPNEPFQKYESVVARLKFAGILWGDVGAVAPLAYSMPSTSSSSKWQVAQDLRLLFDQPVK